MGGSNYCIEIFKDEKGRWAGEVISTFDAYQIVRKGGGLKQGVSLLRNKACAQNGRPLVMRLMIDDTVKMDVNEFEPRTVFRVVTIFSNGQVFMAPINEANVDARNRDKTDPFKYISKMAGSFKKSKARQVTISPIGRLSDPGFKE